MKRQGLIWSLTGISTALGFMLTVQITSRPQGHAGVSSYIDVRTQVAEQAQEHAILEAQISKQEAQLAEFQASAGSQSTMKQVLENDAKSVAEQAGTTPMSGPGLTITIRDDPNLPFDPQFSGTFQKESDQWVSLIVNYLFGNGAQAIGINGQRLVTTSSIRLVSGIDGLGGLHINTHPIAMPYVITAIGNINNMSAAITVNKVKDYLNLMGEDCIIQTYPGKKGVTVPAYTGSLPGNWAKEDSAP